MTMESSPINDRLDQNEAHSINNMELQILEATQKLIQNYEELLSSVQRSKETVKAIERKEKDCHKRAIKVKYPDVELEAVYKRAVTLRSACHALSKTERSEVRFMRMSHAHSEKAIMTHKLSIKNMERMLADTKKTNMKINIMIEQNSEKMEYRQLTQREKEMESNLASLTLSQSDKSSNFEKEKEKKCDLKRSKLVYWLQRLNLPNKSSLKAASGQSKTAQSSAKKVHFEDVSSSSEQSALPNSDIEMAAVPENPVPEMLAPVAQPMQCDQMGKSAAEMVSDESALAANDENRPKNKTGESVTDNCSLMTPVQSRNALSTETVNIAKNISVPTVTAVPATTPNSGSLTTRSADSTKKSPVIMATTTPSCSQSEKEKRNNTPLPNSFLTALGMTDDINSTTDSGNTQTSKIPDFMSIFNLNQSSDTGLAAYGTNEEEGQDEPTQAFPFSFGGFCAADDNEDDENDCDQQNKAMNPGKKGKKSTNNTFSLFGF